MKTKKIKLTKLWSGHEPGEIIEEWEVTVDSMIRKGYGIEVGESRPAKRKRGRPRVERAIDRRPREQAVVTPEPIDTNTDGPTLPVQPEEKDDD